MKGDNIVLKADSDLFDYLLPRYALLIFKKESSH